MFDSPFLSDGSKPIRGAVLTYFSLVIILLSYCIFLWRFVGKLEYREKEEKQNDKSCGQN